MNRLIIIGNGFDLAHGLPTRYKDFIDDFWINYSRNSQSSIYKNFIFCNELYDGYYDASNPIRNFEDFKSNLSEYCKENKYVFSDQLMQAHLLPKSEENMIFNFKNNFFKIINMKKSQNWVDIENEYYSELKRIVRSVKKERLDARINWQEEQLIKVQNLNKEFEQIKNLLENYLKEKVEKNYVFSIDSAHEFTDIFRKDFYEDLDLNKFLKELSREGEKQVQKGFDAYQREFISDGDIPKKGQFKDRLYLDTFFLNFNYTSTVFEHVKALRWDFHNLNQIHGKLDDVKNPINFGFGDEMDTFYQEIEEINDNEYLKNIKSFQYLHTPNYKQLLDLIDSASFQIYIMGHSCGLSDRTLLNTIFEHENCSSIKVFYYEEKDKDGNVFGDNYTELTQNISRHFNDKKLMRSKIVNKTLCQPMPQIKLPLK